MVVRAHDHRLAAIGTKRPLPDGRVAQRLRVFQQRAAQEGKIPRRRDIMFLAGSRREPVGRTKDRARHPQFTRPLVHQLHKGFRGARDLLGQRHGSVIGRLHHQRIQHLIDAERFLFREPHLGTARLGGPGADLDRVLQVHLPLLQFLEQDEQVHQLEHAGRITFGVGVIFKEHPAAGGIHHDRAQVRIARDAVAIARLFRRGRGGWLGFLWRGGRVGGQRDTRQPEAKPEPRKSFHNRSVPIRGTLRVCGELPHRARDRQAMARFQLAGRAAARSR